jgi:hypothetical protein
MSNVTILSSHDVRKLSQLLNLDASWLAVMDDSRGDRYGSRTWSAADMHT